MKKKLIIIIFILLIVVISSTCMLLPKKGKTTNNPEKNKYLIKEPINKLSIRYYPDYNIATGKAINFVDEVKFDLKEEDKKKAIKFLSKIKQSDLNMKECNCDYITDYYEIYINDKTVVSLGDEYGLYGDITFDINKEFKVFIDKIISDYNNKNVYKSLKANNIEIEYEGKKLVLNDEKDINKILEYKYIIAHGNDPYQEYDGGPKGSITLDNNIKIYIYGYVSYILNGEKSTYAIFEGPDDTDLLNIVKNIIENNKLQIKDKLKTDIINIEYKNQKYSITDKKIIEKIYNELINLRYGDYEYLNSMSEAESFDSNDIRITINNCKYYIPGKSSWGSRFFIDVDKKMYDASDLNNSYTEKYIKELVKYNDN